MRLTATLLTFTALSVLMAGCTQRPTAAPLPPKGGPMVVAKSNESAPVEDADAPAGRKVYDAHGCGKCHRPGSKAPDLTKVGAKRSAEWIAEHVRNPRAHGGKMKAYPESQL